MERMITFKSDEFHSHFYALYRSICESVKSASLLHVDTKETNNKSHFDYVVIEANNAIARIIQFYPEHDKRREQYHLLNVNELSREAEKFFATDLY